MLRYPDCLVEAAGIGRLREEKYRVCSKTAGRSPGEIVTDSVLVTLEVSEGT